VRKVEDPLELFAEWYAEAKDSEPKLHDACCLATADADGCPSARFVLLKGWGPDGFDFYTNYDSPKARDLDANPRASLAFHWKSLGRQLRLHGPVERMSEAGSDAYFASRDRISRIGAWASLQSQEMTGRFEFEGRIAKYTAKYAVGDVPRPPDWGGYRLLPRRIEFWQDRKFRLHLRHLYVRADDGWDFVELYP